MSGHKQIDRICAVIVVLALLITVVFMFGESWGLQVSASGIGYEDRLFDTSRVHTIDIVIDDWEGFIESAESEEYEMCSVVIDGEAYKNVAIRAKGNTSLSSVSTMDSERYSFKIEFDHYDSSNTYYGLDKLNLNNIIFDNTYMKDYLSYQMMLAYGVNSPLCSYVYITVNGEDFGLYLAVEGVEDSFLQRNYGNDYGELYKPDSMNFGNMAEDFDTSEFENADFGDFDVNGFDTSSFDAGNFSMDDMMEMFGGDADGGEGMDFTDAFGSMFSMFSSDDVKLQYIDDDPDSYSNIFDSAKTDVTDADQERLIGSLESLSNYENLEEVLDIDQVLRYMVVHTFTVNGDSYTGSMIHNYYLYEEDGQLSMIPWDYNLAYGTFTAGDATSAVNDPIDDELEDRPMQAWIFSSEEYTEMYHEYYAEFLEAVDIQGIIDEAYALIAEYVEKDPTKFCTYEEFETGVEALSEFCSLRAESIEGQLDGSVPSTSEGQSADSSALVDASDLDLSDMGSNSSAGGMDFGDMDFGDFDFSGFSDGDSNFDFSAFTGAEDGTDVEIDTSTFSDTFNAAGQSDTSETTDDSSSAGDTNTDPDIDAEEDTGGTPNEATVPNGDFDPGDMDASSFGDFDASAFAGMEVPDASTGTASEETENAETDTSTSDEATSVPETDASDAAEAEEPGASEVAEAEEDSGQSDAVASEDQEGPTEDASGDATSAMPSMEDMSAWQSGTGASTDDETTALILLGASTLVLLAGLAIAAGFRRW